MRETVRAEILVRKTRSSGASRRPELNRGGPAGVTARVRLLLLLIHAPHRITQDVDKISQRDQSLPRLVRR